MNLKNSKFFKRIQELRRASKDKLRQTKVSEHARVDYELQNVFHEGGGACNCRNCVREIYESVSDNAGEDEEEEESSEEVEIQDQVEEMKSGGIIQLNNVCFRLKCAGRRGLEENYVQNVYKEDLPSISSAKGSMCVANSRYGMIGRVGKALGFRLVKEGKMWNILWTDSLPGVEVYKNMKRFQQINHFPGMMEICRKDLLSRNLNRMLKLFPRDYKIFPKTWIFPADYGDALNYSQNCRNKTRTFIIKPDAGAQGRGIWITSDLKNINPNERMICQTYITKPLLIDGYKFDLRVYTLITSVDPLRIFVYNEGLARFATSKYEEPTIDNATDLFMHLTNYSVNKRSSQYDLCENDDCGSKRKFSAINNWIRSRNYSVDEFWGNIDDIIIKTVLSAWPMLKHNYHACFPSHDKIQACFEILGFDVLVDGKLKPYILEVNHSPSYHTNEPVDRQVKKALIRDTLTLVSTCLADKKQILKEDRKRVKQRLLKLRQQGGDVTSRSNQGGNSGSTNANTNAAGGGACASNGGGAGDCLPGLSIYGTNQNISYPDMSTNPAQPRECPLSALSQQVAWEESHLGDFRRIMPPHESSKLNYYCQFYALQNQASIYGETAASKKREEVAKKLRLELEEKRQRQQEILLNPRLRFEDRRRKRASMPRALAEKQRIQKFRSQAHWSPGFISEAEERLRRSWMQMRMDLLEKMHIIPMIYQHLYNAGSLTDSDIINYPDFYRNLQNGMDIFNETDCDSRV